MPSSIFTGISGPLLPGYATTTICFFLATVTAAAQRLGGLIVIPSYNDERYTASNPPTAQRRPLHVMFQVPATAANPVYVTWDNNTAPVVGGPGMEMEPGTIYAFFNAGPGLMPFGGKTAGLYQCHEDTAFRFIATASTSMLVMFSD